MEFAQGKAGGVSRSQATSPRLSPMDLHPTLSPKHFRETILRSTEENMRKWMHSAQYPEPILGPRRKRGQISTAGGLSTLTQLANQQLTSLLRPSSLSNFPTSPGAYLRPSLNSYPSDSDFKRAIDKLGRIYSQGSIDSLKMSLSEGKSHEIALEAEEKMHVRIATLGQLCPLVVNVFRSRGRLVAYWSKTVQEPMEILCDGKVTGDRIWLSEAGTRFRGNTIYICFLALEESAFTLNVQFGQKKRPIPREKFKSEVPVAPEEEWEQFFSSFTDHKPKFLKNFIAKNRAVQRVDSPEVISDHLEKLVNVDLRRREAVKRWHLQLKLKKKRALDLLNRQQLKEIERQRQLAVAREKAAVAASQQKWLAIVWGIKSLGGWVRQFAVRKAVIAIENKKMSAARRLQRAYRRHMNYSNGKELSLIRAGLSLRLAVRHLAQICEAKYVSQLFRLMQSSSKLARVPIQFLTFYKRSNIHLVVFAQAYWRLVLRRRKQAYERLLSLWNSSLALAISSAGKRKPAVTRGKSRRKVRRLAI